MSKKQKQNIYTLKGNLVLLIFFKMINFNKSTNVQKINKNKEKEFNHPIDSANSKNINFINIRNNLFEIEKPVKGLSNEKGTIQILLSIIF